MRASRRVIPGVLALALSALPLFARDLSFEDRVKAQEAIGTFWLVFGGCGSAVLSAEFPGVGIGSTLIHSVMA